MVERSEPRKMGIRDEGFAVTRNMAVDYRNRLR